MASAAKLLFPVLRPLLPILPHLPTPILTLFPTLALFLASHPSPSPWSFLTSPLTSPIHLPILLTSCLIPLIYLLGLVSNNVSWVDRLWPFYTPVHAGLIVAWAWYNEASGVYGHNLPRMTLMWGLQLVWTTRLLSHALRRGFYDLKGEDYRYTAFKKMAPRVLFTGIVHPIVIALAQPLLLFCLALPLHSLLLLPPSELSSSTLSIPFSAVSPFLPSRFNLSPPSIPVLTITDLFLALFSLFLIYVEFSTDNQMYAYQTAKHHLQSTLRSDSPELVRPAPSSPSSRLPQPAPYPSKYHPGFPTTGWFRFSRHPNFAAEQLFWLTQSLFVVNAGAPASGVTKAGWIAGGVWAPPFALSILFCASTFLTEFITASKYPTYKAYRGLVGQFLPQETALIWLWGTLRGSRAEAKKAVYGVPVSAAKKAE